MEIGKQGLKKLICYGLLLTPFWPCLHPHLHPARPALVDMVCAFGQSDNQLRQETKLGIKSPRCCLEGDPPRRSPALFGIKITAAHVFGYWWQSWVICSTVKACCFAETTPAGT